MAKEKKKTCFILMPITMPKHLKDKYEDENHFSHILNHLFIPAIEEVGYRPIPPKAKGSEIIQARILEQLQQSNLALCDMTAWSPNVFFELGVRTAQNKPVCLVKDNITDKVPFDTSIINYHTYSSELRPWNMKEQQEQLVDHLRESIDSSGEKNTMWDKFSISLAAPIKAGEGEDSQMKLMNLRLDAISYKLDSIGSVEAAEPPQISPEIPVVIIRITVKELENYLYKKTYLLIEFFLMMSVGLSSLVPGQLYQIMLKRNFITSLQEMEYV